MTRALENDSIKKMSAGFYSFVAMLGVVGLCLVGGCGKDDTSDVARLKGEVAALRQDVSQLQGEVRGLREQALKRPQRSVRPTDGADAAAHALPKHPASAPSEKIEVLRKSSQDPEMRKKSREERMARRDERRRKHEERRREMESRRKVRRDAGAGAAGLDSGQGGTNSNP